MASRCGSRKARFERNSPTLFCMRPSLADPNPGAVALEACHRVSMTTDLRTDRTTLHRLPERGHHDRATIDAILDEAIVCHLGFVEEGQPYVIPTVFARVDDDVYVHGAAASRTLRTMRDG